MKRFKRILRLTVFSFMMVLASIGMGITGPFPLIMNRRREDEEIKIELVEVREEEKTDEEERE
jgi:hypothetical protein